MSKSSISLFSLTVAVLTISACSTSSPENPPLEQQSSSSHSREVSSASSSSSTEVISLRHRQIPFDERKTTYHNEQWGFSLDIPTYLVAAGGCDTDPYPPDGYPLKVIEQDNVIFLTPAFYGRNYLVGEEPNGSGIYECSTVEVRNLDQIQEDMMDELFFYFGWKMVAQKVSNDAELLAFIRKWYGPGCEISAKSPTTFPGTWDVEIKGDTTSDIENSQCPINFLYGLKYAPDKQTVVTWKIGQDGRFDDLDRDMRSSFRFDR